MTPDDIAAAARMTCGMFPNQFEGELEGRAFYFRARHGYWALRLAPPGGHHDDAIYGEIAAEGVDDQAGAWDEVEAREVLAQAIREYLAKLAL